MNKVILTVLVLAIGFVGFAQDKTNKPQQSKYVTTSNGSVIFRMTDDMSDDEIKLEFINNFFKIEMSDLIINQKKSLSKNQDNLSIETKHSIKDESSMLDQIIISDLAIRTTTEMRASLYLTEEITA
ncbi:MAG: hypothetical protein L3J20_05385 [Flavobacteriaceae bacterium]|nr:hypothetical protein [Flavobacteriaceae bacterium]